MTAPGLDRQIEIYTGRCDSALPFSYEEWEEQARETLPPPAFGYIAGGAGAEDTMRANLEAFSRRRIVPRMLRDVSSRDLAISLFGTPLPVPLIMGPVGVQSIIHPAAEGASARAARRLNLPFVLSTVSSLSIEEVAREMEEASRWFQLYPGKDPEVVASMVHRAEAAGYSALVVTLDTTMLGWRERDLRHAYLPFLQGKGLANFLSDPVFRAALPVPPEQNPTAAVMHFLDIYVNPAFSWNDLRDLRELTRLPLVLKGILHADDARQAVDLGVDGLVVSNHGGRQVDGAVAALDALPPVRAVVPDRLPLLFDSGVRRGADVMKALALGARAVLIGRPYLYGLAVAGEEGVYTVMRNLIAEFDLQTGLSGGRSAAEIDQSILAE